MYAHLQTKLSPRYNRGLVYSMKNFSSPLTARFQVILPHAETPQLYGKFQPKMEPQSSMLPFSKKSGSKGQVDKKKKLLEFNVVCP